MSLGICKAAFCAVRLRRLRAPTVASAFVCLSLSLTPLLVMTEAELPHNYLYVTRSREACARELTTSQALRSPATVSQTNSSPTPPLSARTPRSK